MASGEPEDWKSRFECVADDVIALRVQLQQAQESLKRELAERAEVYNNHVIACKAERDNYHASWEGAKIRASLAEQAADAAIERGVRACEEIQYLYMRWREAERRVRQLEAEHQAMRELAKPAQGRQAR